MAEHTGVYAPIDGGWTITLDDESPATAPEPSRIGVVADLPPTTGHDTNPDVEKRLRADDPREHRRPLYPPADRELVFSRDELAGLERCPFRPLILAYSGLRFVFDLHNAGGLLGHLCFGFIARDGRSKWLQEFSRIEVRYVRGRMEYALRDPAFPGAEIRLGATALAGAAGIAVSYSVSTPEPATFLWFYGGASGYYTNYSFGSPNYRFAPEQSRSNRVSWQEGVFTLCRIFDEAEKARLPSNSAPRALRDFAPEIRGGSRGARCGIAAPEAAMGTPSSLRDSTSWLEEQATASREGCVAVQAVSIPRGTEEGYVVVGMGHALPELLASPEEAWRAALGRNESIAGRVSTRTPDPYLDAATSMMAFPTEGIWADLAYAHGAWSWRQAYLGWRSCYGPDCYGWTDRARKSIVNHIALGVVQEGEDRGAVGHMLDHAPAVFYNMDEVFLDMVRHYWEYTADLALMREIYPALVRILEWEARRLQPGNECLYENSLNTWISDSHWYIRAQCTQASAYMLRAHRFLAEIAARLGKDPSPFEQTARRIELGMHRKLWIAEKGVYAECLDTLGAGLRHDEPELPTIFHASEFGAADELESYEMTRWVDASLGTSQTPGGGRLYWSSNWHPNQGRSYTHSTFEMDFADCLNYAETLCRVGRADDAYAVIRASLCGIFNGPTPGGLSCHAYTDGRQRANDEFADAISMWGRTVLEGLFGIVLKEQHSRVELRPMIPSSWKNAQIRTPAFSYSFASGAGHISLSWEAAKERSVWIRLPLRARRVLEVSLDGCPVAHSLEAGVGLSWLCVRTPACLRGALEVRYEESPAAVPVKLAGTAGEEVALDLEGLLASPGADGVPFLNPQAAIIDARIEGRTLTGRLPVSAARRLLFLHRAGDCPAWIPVQIEALPKEAVAPKVWTPPLGLPRELDRWHCVDLAGLFNCSVSEALGEALKRAVAPEPPASPVGFRYRNDHMGARVTKAPSDQAWRAKVGDDGIAWTADGIPFRSARNGDNIALVSRNEGFPHRMRVAVHATGQTLYLMVSGITFPAQSHVPNLRLELRYADGTCEERDLVNPFDIGDCWGTWMPHYHDTASNGFENLGGRFGPSGSAEAGDLERPIRVDTEAHLIALPLRPAKLSSLDFAAVANDVVYGLMGVSVLKTRGPGKPT